MLLVASLGLVLSAVATDGVNFSLKKMTMMTFLVIAVYKVMTFLSSRLVTTPTFRPRFYFIRVSPTADCHPGRSAPSLVTPLHVAITDCT